jgi:CBS domain-containing protein
VAEALTLMGRENLDVLPVVDRGHVEGVVTRSQIMQLLQLKAELAA